MGIKKQIAEKLRKRAEPEPEPASASVSPYPYPKQPPELVSFNCENSPTEFLLVSGLYNALLAKGFGVPIVGLMQGWHPGYATLPLFADAKRIEIVISRVPHNIAPPRELAQAASVSANAANNLEFLRSVAGDDWIRERSVVSNDGVFDVARLRRQFGNDPMMRGEYLKHFVEFPVDAEHLTRLCAPPAAPPRTPEFRDSSTLYWNYGINPVAPNQEAPGTGCRDSRYGELEVMRATAAARKEAEGELDFVDRMNDWRPSAEVLKSMKDWNKS